MYLKESSEKFPIIFKFEINNTIMCCNVFLTYV